MVLQSLFRIFMPSKMYARFIGVKLGKNCFIATKNWSSEPYLIEVGNNVQITNGVSIHTHGGGTWQDIVSRILIPLARWLLKMELILVLIRRLCQG